MRRTAGRCGHRPLRRLEEVSRLNAVGHAEPALQCSTEKPLQGGPCVALRETTMYSYISKHQRQRRRGRDDPTFRAPCKIFQTCGTHQNNFPMCGARLGIQNLGFGGVLWSLSFAEERKEPAGGTKRIPPHKPHPRRTKRPAGVFFPSEIAVPVVRPAAQVVADVCHAQKRHHQKHARNHDDPPRVCQQRLLRE